MAKYRLSLNNLYLLYLLLLLISLPSHAQEHSQLQQLLAPFGKVPHVKLDYQEKRFSLFFKKPRLYLGTIEYISPDTFIKSVTSPDHKKFVLQQNTLSIYDYTALSEEKPATIHKVSLDDYPQFKQLKALFIGLFRGDASKLLEFYQYKINVLENHKIHLVLKSLVSDQLILDSHSTTSKQQVDIFFQQQRIIKIIMQSPGNERSELVFKTALESSIK